MAGITLTQAETMLAEVLAAYSKALQLQEYSIKDRATKRARLVELEEAIEKWDARVKKLTQGASGRRVRGATPLD